MQDCCCLQVVIEFVIAHLCGRIDANWVLLRSFLISTLLLFFLFPFVKISGMILFALGSSRPPFRLLRHHSNGWETGCQFSPLSDAFHPSFPTSEEEISTLCVSGRVGLGQSEHACGHDPIFSLPNEVSDLILSYLSPAALDAARNTCRFWRTKIMGISWVLGSVLELVVTGNKKPSRFSEEIGLR